MEPKFKGLSSTRRMAAAAALWGALACAPAMALDTGVLYVAVPDGSKPGIYQVADGNGDGDALDSGEVRFYTGIPGGASDVVADGVGALFATSVSTGAIYRIEDRNSDGDAVDGGEVTVFRSPDAASASGVLLVRPTSLAVATFLDPFSGKTRVRLFSMDVVLQQALVLEDLDGDGDAGDGAELVVVKTGGKAFTPERMLLDGAGRLVAVNTNRLSLVRLRDLNGDTDVSQSTPREKYCPVVVGACGAPQIEDFQVIRSPQSGQKLNLKGPYGVTQLSDASWLVSDPGSGKIYRLADLDFDEDAQGSSEIRSWASVRTSTDLVADEHDLVYLGAPINGQPANLLLLHDADASGTIGSAEIRPFAQLPGTPAGIDLLRRFEPQNLVIHAASGFEISPLKGAMLVLEPGHTAQIGLKIIDADTGLPAAHLRVANGVLAGCLSVCSASVNQTDADGAISYQVERTADDGAAESLKFWAEDGSGGPLHGKATLLVPVVRTPCSPLPAASGGADQIVAAGASVTLDGTASSGQGLKYCWVQTAGPGAGIAECSGDEPVVSFTAPSAAAVQTFTLQVRNACDMMSELDEVKVVVPDEIPDAFSFPPVTGAAPDAWTPSAAVTLSGFNVGLPVAVSGAEYRVKPLAGDWGAWVTAPGSVVSGDELQLKVKSSASPGATVAATLTVGSVSGGFSVTTAAAP